MSRNDNVSYSFQPERDCVMPDDYPHRYQRFDYAGRETMFRLIEAGYVSTEIDGYYTAGGTTASDSKTDADEVRDAIETALVQLAGAASVEAIERVSNSDLPAQARQEAHTALSEAVPDPPTLAAILDKLRVRAETVVCHCWPIIEGIAAVFGQEPFSEFEEEEYIFSSLLAQLEVAYICSIAAVAVCTDVLPGGSVRWAILGGHPDLGSSQPVGGVRTVFPASWVLQRVLGTREPHIHDPAIQEHYRSLRERTKSLARKRDVIPATLERVATELAEYERAIDEAVGPIAPALYPELTRLAESSAVRVWVGEIASERMIGISIPDRMGQVEVIRNFLMMQLPPKEAVARLLAAREPASVLVTGYRPAIALARHILQRDRVIDGEQLHHLIHEVLPPFDDQVA